MTKEELMLQLLEGYEKCPKDFGLKNHCGKRFSCTECWNKALEEKLKGENK